MSNKPQFNNKKNKFYYFHGRHIVYKTNVIALTLKSTTKFNTSERKTSISVSVIQWPWGANLSSKLFCFSPNIVASLPVIVSFRQFVIINNFTMTTVSGPRHLLQNKFKGPWIIQGLFWNKNIVILVGATYSKQR